MRNAGTQLRPMSAALIPPKGILFGAIDPAIHAVWEWIPKKKPSTDAGQVTRIFSQLRVLPLEVVMEVYVGRRGKVKNTMAGSNNL